MLLTFRLTHPHVWRKYNIPGTREAMHKLLRTVRLRVFKIQQPGGLFHEDTIELRASGRKYAWNKACIFQFSICLDNPRGTCRNRRKALPCTLLPVGKPVFCIMLYLRNFFHLQVGQLCKRTFQRYLRNPLAVKARIGQTIIASLFMIAIFWKVTKTSDKMGVLFFCAVNVLFDALMSSLLLFLNQRPAYLRELTNDTYIMESYFVSVLLVEIPF